jgi:hypothetical protein
MKKIIITIAFLGSISVYAQGIFMTRSGQITFFSRTPLENIEAVNNEVSSMVNTQNGDLVFAVLIKSFRFEKALMEEHFNENYMESAKIPKATFQGKITNLPTIDFKRNGTYPATVEGDLTIHGVTQHIVTSGTVTVEDGKLVVGSTFYVLINDYKIQKPSLVAEKIAEKIEVKINCRYEPKV